MACKIMHDRILRSEIYSILGFSFQVFELITRQNGKDLNLIYSLPKKTLSKGNCIQFGKHYSYRNLNITYIFSDHLLNQTFGFIAFSIKKENSFTNFQPHDFLSRWEIYLQIFRVIAKDEVQ